MATLAQASDGDLALPLRIVRDPAEACALKLRNRFRLFLGEWFLDVRVGVPYFAVVFVPNPDIRLIRQLFRRIILGTPPVVELEALDLDFDRATRRLSFSFRARTNEGAVITGGSGDPFIVEVER